MPWLGVSCWLVVWALRARFSYRKPFASNFAILSLKCVSFCAQRLVLHVNLRVCVLLCYHRIFNLSFLGKPYYPFQLTALVRLTNWYYKYGCNFVRNIYLNKEHWLIDWCDVHVCGQRRFCGRQKRNKKIVINSLFSINSIFQFAVWGLGRSVFLRYRLIENLLVLLEIKQDWRACSFKIADNNFSGKRAKVSLM